MRGKSTVKHSAYMLAWQGETIWPVGQPGTRNADQAADGSTGSQQAGATSHHSATQSAKQTTFYVLSDCHFATYYADQFHFRIDCTPPVHYHIFKLLKN
jgi:hypothetical protein